jgi:preprotein translocase subunit SecA
VMRQLERDVVLSVLDRKWREHLYEMDYLQEGIQLRSYGQRDPLVEYQREGFTMFATMMDAIKEESVGLLFNSEVRVAVDPPAVPAEASDEADIPDAEPRAPQAAAPKKTLAQQVAAGDGAGNGVPHLVVPGLQQARRPTRLEYSAPTIDGDTNGGLPAALGGAAAAAVAAAAASNDAPLMYEGTPRNAKCPCGSGRTYKRCHGDPRSGV